MRITAIVLVAVAPACDDSAHELWHPGIVYAAPAQAPRGMRDLRGIIHAHSVYSHDACDNEPVKNGERDPVCFDDFRRGLCRSLHDFVMLTDHPSAFSTIPYPDTLLYRGDRGDWLVEHLGVASANRLRCPDGHRALVLAGAESGEVMPVGLESHVDAADRSTAYSTLSVEGSELVAGVGGLVLLAHTESKSVDTLASPPVDGFEMFNLHANTLRNIQDALELVVLFNKGSAGLPHPDAVLMPLLDEDPVYLQRWGEALSRGVRRVTTVGTDCHQNTFPSILSDGERIDSYRRMMIAFSNHLLVRPQPDGTFDDRDLKTALAAGRLYGAFEILGYPEGFDYFAESARGIAEMGDEVQSADTPVLHVAAPRLRGLDTANPPEMRVRLLRAVATGWEEVAAGDGDLELAITTPGAYRAEVDLVPYHLYAYLGDFADRLANASAVWIYSNAIYVR